MNIVYLSIRMTETGRQFYNGAHVLRDHLYNIAWWDKDYYKIGSNGHNMDIHDKPMNFLHFSGFKIDDLKSIGNIQ